MLGQPLPWNLYNQEGDVLFKKGIVINTPKSFERLQTMGLYRDSQPDCVTTQAQSSTSNSHDNALSAPIDNSKSSSNVRSCAQDGGATAGLSVEEKSSDIEAASIAPALVFEGVENCILQFKQACEDIVKGKGKHLSTITSIANTIQDLTRGHEDECLAIVHAMNCYPQSIILPIKAAIMCNLLAQKIGFNSDARNSLVCAALTANLGMYEHFDTIIRQQGKPTQQQSLIINTHCNKSIRLLRNMGVTDNKWLTLVSQHHERYDGKGYPMGLRGNEIAAEVPLYSIVDTYLSLIMPRAYRQSLEPYLVTQKLFQYDITSDEQLLKKFEELVGQFPPGTAVILRNNEIAMVVERNQENPAKPVVVSLAQVDGIPLSEPVVRETSDERYSVQGVYKNKFEQNVDLEYLYAAVQERK